MSFYNWLKALRKSAKLSRQQTVALLTRQGIRTSVATLRRLEDGNNRSMDLVLALLNLYHSRAPIRPGSIETALLARASRETLNDRRRRWIANNLHHCGPHQLAQIERIIQKHQR